MLSTFASAEQLPALDEVTPDIGFKYFSGYLTPYNNHPTIYAHSSNQQQKLVVVGNGFYREYPLSEINKAVEAYKSLLQLCEYKQ